MIPQRESAASLMFQPDEFSSEPNDRFGSVNPKLNLDPDWADADNSIPDSADSITDAPAFINGFCGWACAP